MELLLLCLICCFISHFFGEKKDDKKMIDWIDCWRNNCAHSGGKENCINCYPRKECDKAIDKIRKTLRRKQ